MNLKSLVNKSVIKSDLRRYWYLGAIFTIMLLLMGVMPAYIAVNSTYYGHIQTTKDFLSHMQLTLFAIITCCVVSPAMVFSYLHHRSGVHTIHSLPLKRGTLYFSHIVSVAILEIIPVILNMLIMLTIKGINPAYVLLWAALTIVYVFFITACGTVVSVFTANVFASIIIPYCVIILPFFIEVISEALCHMYLFGYTNNHSMSISSHIYADYTRICNGMLYVYIALGLVFFVLGFIGYKKRALENHSQLAAFKFLNPIFIYGVAICAGLLGYIYVVSLLETTGKFWIAIPFGIAGIIGAKMITDRTFRPKKIIKPSVVYLAILCCIYALIGFDITGYENRVPDVDEIASASIVESYSGEQYYSTAQDYVQVKLAPEAVHDSALYNAEDIEKVIALHSEIIKNEELADNKNDRQFAKNIPIKYVLKNGRTIERSYIIYDSSNELNELYKSVMETKPIKADRFPIISDVEQEYISAQVSTCGTNTTNLTNEQMDKLCEVLREDILFASNDDYNVDALTSVNLVRTMPSVDDNGNPIPDKKGWAQQSCTYDIHPAYKKTIALLSEWGMYNVMPEPDKISYVEISGDELITETDKEYIAKCLDYLYKNSDNLGNSYDSEVMYITIFYNDDTAYTVNIKDLPQ